MKNPIVNANNIIHVDVKNLLDESLGSIEALMLDKKTGQVAYAVLSNNILGRENKLMALPWSIFFYDDNEECFRVPIAKEKLKSSPNFDKDNWPNMSSESWSASINKYYGTTDLN